ncbi:cytochrome P450 [Byssothecium circinans]|uniref:Cytochrome P450 n=1 Tax=Byssothecium circinans TaxID=147558 RepID=A0A6A5TZK2_9PLEO|nr:cytochrome P450 [Byssothecium circinans]
MDLIIFLNGFASTPFFFGVAAVVFIFLTRVLGPKRNAAEPPFIPMSVPYFGHLYGILVGQASYYVQLSKKYGHQLYSLAMPGGRIYIVNSPDLISIIQKHPRVLSHWYIAAALTKNLGGISNEANAILLENARGDKGQNSLVIDGMKATHKAMSGEHLDNMTLAAIRRAKNVIAESGPSPGKVELWDWVQHCFSLAVSSSVYGHNNPYENERLERGLSQFADQTPTFLTGLPPWIFAPKAYRAREAIVARFQQYFGAKSDENASELVKARANVLREYGVPESDIARFEAVNGFGILLNLLPTAFWTIYHIFSDPDLLDAVRQEAVAAGLDKCADILPNSVEELAKLDDLPLLTSVLKESLRTHAAGVAARMVMDDHMFDGQYLLKRDTYLFIPNRAVHFDRTIWGDNVNEFVPHRFTKHNGEKIHPAAFRGFGGGVNLCPGRLFSIKLITAVTASLVLRHDIKPLNKSGALEDPGNDERSQVIALARPLKECMVEFVSREAS